MIGILGDKSEATVKADSGGDCGLAGICTDSFSYSNITVESCDHLMLNKRNIFKNAVGKQ